MPNFDYPMAVGAGAAMVLAGLWASMWLIRQRARRRTDDLLLRLAEAEDEVRSSGNITPSEVVGPKNVVEPKENTSAG